MSERAESTQPGTTTAGRSTLLRRVGLGAAASLATTAVLVGGLTVAGAMSGTEDGPRRTAPTTVDDHPSTTATTVAPTPSTAAAGGAVTTMPAPAQPPMVPTPVAPTSVEDRSGRGTGRGVDNSGPGRADDRTTAPGTSPPTTVTTVDDHGRHGADDGAAHDVGDDHGADDEDVDDLGRHGADDGAAHGVGDDHGGGGHGADDPSGHH